MRILMVKGASFNNEVPQVSYPLGLMYLASFLMERQKDHHIELMDLRCLKRPYKSLRKKLASWKPRIVAISALTCEAESLHRTAAIAKELDPECTVVVGGPHISACTADVINDTNIDVLSIGEAEETFAELVGAMSTAESFQGVRGIAWRNKDREMIWESPRDPIQDLDTIPYPAWDLIDIDTYAEHGRAGNIKRGRFLPLFTSRGCPYGCFYCHNLFGKRFRARSPENVIGELRLMVEKYGVRDIEVVDDIFNLDLDRAKAICRGIIDLNMLLVFPNGLRADRLDRELIHLMARAGTTNLAVAVETASERLQKNICKNLDLDRVREAITWADEEGIVTNGYFMLGFPSETADEIRQTIAYAETTDLFFASFFIVTPYPGTPLWNQTMSESEAASLDFKSYNYLSGYFNLADVSDSELRALQREAYRRFYRKKRWKIVRSTFNLRLDWKNAAWLWFGRMRDQAQLRVKKTVDSGKGERKNTHGS